MERPEFRLNEFRDAAKWVEDKFPPPVAFFLNGWLWGLESRYIAYKARRAVDKGIAPIAPQDPVIDPPRHLSEPSEVEGLDNISFHYEFTRTRKEDQR